MITIVSVVLSFISSLHSQEATRQKTEPFQYKNINIQFILVNSNGY
jgi:hypothetical protein